MSDKEAVDRAVQRCIEEGILMEYLQRKRAEAVRMFLTEFDENTWRESMREEGREEQRAQTEAERRRAESERQRADLAEQRVKELEAKLAELGIVG